MYPAEDFAVAHHHFTFHAVLAHKGHMPGYRLVDGFVAFDATDIPGTNDGALTGTSPQASSPKTPCQIVGFFVVTTRPVIRSCIVTGKFIPGNRRVGISPSISMLFCKLPDGMYGNDFAFFPLS